MSPETEKHLQYWRERRAMQAKTPDRREPLKSIQQARRMHKRFNPCIYWRVHIPRRSARAYAFATVLVVIATLARWGLGFLDREIAPFATYFPAVLFATYMGGLEAGIFTAVAGGLIAWWAFLPPHFGSFPWQIAPVVTLLTYLFVCVLVIWGTDLNCRLTKRVQDQEKLRKLAVNELAHRLKNKIATIQSIISFQLRAQPQLRDDINKRLVTLSATDDLIMATQGRGADIRDILSVELGPYGVSRIALGGPNVFLPSNFATVMALVIHELATNAAKYGALKSSVGQLSVRWSLAAGLLKLEWRESDGPTVAPPAHKGFGLGLLSRALDHFGGTVTTTFSPTGLVCKMQAKLPESELRLFRDSASDAGSLAAK